MAANFDDGDLLVILTYDDKHMPDSRDKAVRKMRSFLSKLKKARAERGGRTPPPRPPAWRS